jgi:hypothetical protein
MEFVVHVVIMRQVVGWLLNSLEQVAFSAGSTQHEKVINVGIGETVRRVEVLR